MEVLIDDHKKMSSNAKIQLRIDKIHRMFCFLIDEVDEYTIDRISMLQFLEKFSRVFVSHDTNK